MSPEQRATLLKLANEATVRVLPAALGDAQVAVTLIKAVPQLLEALTAAEARIVTLVELRELDAESLRGCRDGRDELQEKLDAALKALERLHEAVNARDEHRVTATIANAKELDDADTEAMRVLRDCGETG